MCVCVAVVEDVKDAYWLPMITHWDYTSSVTPGKRASDGWAAMRIIQFGGT